MPSRVAILVSLAVVIGGSVPLLAAPIPCDTSDNTECTTAGTCQADGTCKGEPTNEGQPCTQSVAGDCMTNPVCQDGACVGTVQAPDGTACTQDISGGCMTNPVCQSGICLGTVSAPEGTPCSLPGLGKCYTPECHPPVPGIPFTTCLPGAPKTCQQPADPCKASTCDPQTGACGEGEKCAGAFFGCEVCNGGTCTPKNIGGPCTNPDGDFNPCTTDDRCVLFEPGSISELTPAATAHLPSGLAAVLVNAQQQVALPLAICQGVPGGAGPTATPTTMPTQTPTVMPTACSGDCDNNQEVSVGEVVTMVNITLETEEYSQCERGDADNDGVIRINDIVIGVNHALHGCAG